MTAPAIVDAQEEPAPAPVVSIAQTLQKAVDEEVEAVLKPSIAAPAPVTEETEFAADRNAAEVAAVDEAAVAKEEQAEVTTTGGVEAALAQDSASEEPKGGVLATVTQVVEPVQAAIDLEESPAILAATLAEDTPTRKKVEDLRSTTQQWQQGGQKETNEVGDFGQSHPEDLDSYPSRT